MRNIFFPHYLSGEPSKVQFEVTAINLSLMPELNLTIVIVSKFCIIFQDTHNSMLQK